MKGKHSEKFMAMFREEGVNAIQMKGKHSAILDESWQSEGVNSIQTNKQNHDYYKKDTDLRVRR